MSSVLIGYKYFRTDKKIGDTFSNGFAMTENNKNEKAAVNYGQVATGAGCRFAIILSICKRRQHCRYRVICH